MHNDVYRTKIVYIIDIVSNIIIILNYLEIKFFLLT